LSLAMFVVGNYDEFTTNSDIHSNYTRQNTLLHPPSTRLTKFQKGFHCMAVKIFNKLPLTRRNLSHKKKHKKKALKILIIRLKLHLRAILQLVLYTRTASSILIIECVQRSVCFLAYSMKYMRHYQSI
jgi:hypothetical protein